MNPPFRSFALLACAAAALLVFPCLVLFGGSVRLIHWGPGMVAAAMALLVTRGIRKTKVFTDPHVLCFLALMVVLACRAALSPSLAANLHHLALIGLAVLGYAMGRSLTGSGRDGLMLGLASAACLHFFCMIRQMVVPEWNLLYPARTAAFPSGLFSHYNYAAGFCLGSFALLTVHGFQSRGWMRLAGLAAAVASLASIPLSCSRGANLALALMILIGILLLAFRDRNSPVTRAWFWLPGLALAAILPFVLLHYAPVILVPLTGRGEGSGGFFADGGRTEMWSAAIRLANEHPWLGGGAGSYEWNVYQILSNLGAEPGMAHNEGLQLAAEYGYPALVAMGMLFAWPILNASHQVAGRQLTFAHFLLPTALVAVLFQANFSFLFHTAPGAFLVACLLGVLRRSVHEARSGAHRDAIDRSSPEAMRDFLTRLGDLSGKALAGDGESLSDLHRHLMGSRCPMFEERAHDLTYWKKKGDPEMLRRSLESLRAAFPADGRMNPDATMAGIPVGGERRRWFESKAKRERRLLIERIHRHGRNIRNGSEQALPSLVRLLESTHIREFEQRAFDLLYWRKKGDRSGEMASLAKLLEDHPLPTARAWPRRRYSWPAAAARRCAALLAWPARATLLASCLAILLFGMWAARALFEAWRPLYRPAGLLETGRFPRLLEVVERHPGIGLDRKLLHFGLADLYRFESLEWREEWADAYHKRLQRVVRQWRQDPGCALQMAEVMGWAGDVDAALALYDHAIRWQGNNESIFLARAYKGRYLYELALSSEYDGDSGVQEHHLVSALRELRASSREAGWPFRRQFGDLLKECESSLAAMGRP